MRTYYRKTNDEKKSVWKGDSNALTGSIHITILSILMIAFVTGGIYLYSVNKSAVQGYHMRTLEKEIRKLRQDNENLKISEADLRSLYRIETVKEDLRMQKVEAPLFLEDVEVAIQGHDRSVALR